MLSSPYCSTDVSSSENESSIFDQHLTDFNIWVTPASARAKLVPLSCFFEAGSKDEGAVPLPVMRPRTKG